MLEKAALAILAGGALTVSAPAAAQSQARQICIRAQPLSAALLDLARQTGIELLSDPQIASGIGAPSVCGRLTAEAALRRLLAGSGLTVRRSASGAWIVERPQAPAGEEAPDPPTPEILVVGRRTQNNDIRRTENDIQPYRVATREQIVRAHRDTIDQYFQSRVPANTQAVPPNLTPRQKGATNSAIDLRGLGTESTLMLVDGRRLPSPPATFFGFNQSDLNAIPLNAIERIETLTGTAGGIYGFGALGGVVNVVLKRDYRGLELHATGGISTRGDAARVRIEGRLGFTPDDGATDVMLALSHSESQPLEVGQRDYNQLNRRQSYARLEREGSSVLVPGNAVSMSSEFPWPPLVFKPEYGGGALGSHFTSLPLGFAGDPAKLPAALLANAGRLNADLTKDEQASEIGSSQTASTAIFNVRHRFGGGIEGYFDALILRNRGRHVLRAGQGELQLAADDPINPFLQPLDLTFPTPSQTVDRARYDSTRYTVGLIADLPLGWRGTAEATFGEAVYANSSSTGIAIPPAGLPGEPIDPALNPLGNWDAFQHAIAAYKSDLAFATTTGNRYREQSLRLAGPIFRTAAGAAVLTLLAEHRGERVDGYSQTSVFDAMTTKEHVPTFWATDTTSFYGELRSRLFGDAAPLPLLRSFEVQLAVRHDVERVTFTADLSSPATSSLARRSFPGTAYTAGAKVTPIPWLTLRGSYATGRQAPPLPMLTYAQFTNYNYYLQDPKRPADYQNDFDNQYLIMDSGNPALKTIHASTLSLGAVLNPAGGGRPRLAIDYSRIRRRGDVVRIDEGIALAHEDELPGRITRAPLTDADRALGYTAGRITVIDARALNAGSLDIDTIDGQFDWDLPFLGGALHLYGIATLQLRNVQRGPFDGGVDRIGYSDGPLKWRANGGVDWTRGATTLGLNLQYFGRYRFYGVALAGIAAILTEGQASAWLPPQAYLDLHVTRRLRIGGQQIQLDLGIVNLLDSSPPRDVNNSSIGDGFSYYGDPRRRRLELSLGTRF